MTACACGYTGPAIGSTCPSCGADGYLDSHPIVVDGEAPARDVAPFADLTDTPANRRALDRWRRA